MAPLSGWRRPWRSQCAAKLANDVSACVPVNVLGGNFTQAQRDYVLKDTVAMARRSSMLWPSSRANVEVLRAPGGPIGIVLGAEYRADDSSISGRRDRRLGYTFYNAIPDVRPPRAKVKEAFGEIRLPISRTPGLQELEVSGAARVSDYSLGNTGTVWAYNGIAVWSPVQGLRLRGNYARSVRAPNQVELFTPFGQNFAIVNDPCDANQLALDLEIALRTAWRPAFRRGLSFLPSSLPFLSGGNVELEAEKSDWITVGGVITPVFLPGFSLSADYYNIKVKNVIRVVAAQPILNICYDSPDLNNPFCASVRTCGRPAGGHAVVHMGLWRTRFSLRRSTSPSL